MNIGMLWFDDSSTIQLSEKIERAARYYAEKYGHRPNLCYVNPAMLNGDSVRLSGDIEIKSSKTIQQYHLWLGLQQMPGTN